ncbi:uncharacterized protein DEA37_0003129 [Paragonimus westermani]|uniref:Uncharacterized protein n=1 Tax=Paragonimus westermani TaxID=34504 RepID=A0A5J4NM27_9TREM|nr:uncharacterized protein DEA37_0003129 [Paragonimus westermani]
MLLCLLQFEMLEHYGSEHYCPLSMIRLFGRVSDDLDEEDDDLALRTADELSTSVPSTLSSDVFSDVSISSGSLEPTDPIETSENMLPNITEDVEAESAQLHFVPPNAVSTLETQNHSDENLSEVSESTEGSLSQTDFTNTNTNRHTNFVLLNRASQLKNKLTGTPSANAFRDALPEASVEMSCNAEFSADLGVHCPNSRATRFTSGSLSTVKSTATFESTDATPNTISAEVKVLHWLGIFAVNCFGCPATRDSLASDSRIRVTFGLLPKNRTGVYEVPGSLQSDARGWRSEQHTHTSTAVQPANSQKSALSSTAPLFSSDAHQVLKHKVEGFVPQKPTFGIFQRLKEVFLSAVGFVFHSMVSPVTDFERQEYNLSTVPLCSQHLLAIRSLFVYGLLNHSKTSELPIQLPESKKRGLDILLCCLQHLEGLVEEEYSRASTDSVSIKHRILRISQKDGRPAVTSCEESIKLLNLSFAAVHKYDQSYWRSDYNILQLFVAHRYFFLFGNTSVEEFFVRIWCELQGSLWTFPDTGLKAMMSCVQPMCPKLPSFLLKLASETEFVKPVISYEPTLRSEAPSYSTLNKHNSGYSKIESAKTRAEIVVPAALVGSRKDTTLMRLSNRVRLLERNVSVSMRYLEELSQSYRRQMDRLSRSFNLTTAWLKVTAQGAEERDHMQQARIDELEIRFDELLTRLIPEALRSASNDSIFSENNVSHSTSKQNLTIPPVMSVPSLLNFDAPPDWAHSTATWPPLEDDWSEEDGTVETEDEHSVEPRAYRDEKIRPEERSGDAMIYGNVFEHRDCASAVYSSEPDTLKQMFENWFSFSLPSTPFRFSGKWTLQLPREDSHVFWIFSMTVIHLVFAVTSHLIVYLAWLRPYSQKLRNSSGSFASLGKDGIGCMDFNHPLRHIPNCSLSSHCQPKAPVGVLTDLISFNSANHNSFATCSKYQSISPHGEYIAQFATTKEQSSTLGLTESTENKNQPHLIDHQVYAHVDQPADAGCQPSNAVTVCDSSSHLSSSAGLTSVPTCAPCVYSSHAKFERRVELSDLPRIALKTDSSNSWTSYPKHLADGFFEKTTLENKAYSHSSVLSKNARRRRNRRERVKLHKIRMSSEDVGPNSSSTSSIQG